MLRGFFENVRGRRQQRRDSDRQIQELIEHSVDKYDRKIRCVSSYSRKLRDAVESAQEHISGLVEAMPEPVECSPERYVPDPLINAMFSGTRHIGDVLHKGNVLPEFFLQNPEDIDRCSALMLASMSERTLLGKSLTDSGMVISEVCQTSVNFDDHQIIAPSADIEGAKLGMQRHLHEILLSQARLERAQLIRKRTEERAAITQTSPDESLDILASSLRSADSILSLDRVNLAVNAMGIKLEDEREIKHRAITLPKLHINGDQSLVPVFITVPRKAVDYNRKAGFSFDSTMGRLDL